LSDTHAILDRTQGLGVNHERHDPDVPHQFDDLAQKNEVDTLGMWTFLATEVLFFGGLFGALTVYRFLYFDSFHEGSEHLYKWIGFINTGVLLCSSFTVVLSVHAAKEGNNNQLILWLAATVLCGLTFLGIKAVEYTIDFHENLIPNSQYFGMEPDAAQANHDDKISRLEAWKESGWKWTDADNPTDISRANEATIFMRHAMLFYVFYYTMTAIHALHMVIGLVIFGILIYRAKHNHYTPRAHAQIEIVGLYWHFVDIVWLFLFPLLYLIR